MVGYDRGVQEPGVEVEKSSVEEVLEKLWELHRGQDWYKPEGKAAKEEFYALLEENAFQILPLAEKGLKVAGLRSVLKQVRKDLLRFTAGESLEFLKKTRQPVMRSLEQIDNVLDDE